VLKVAKRYGRKKSNKYKRAQKEKKTASPPMAKKKQLRQALKYIYFCYDQKYSQASQKMLFICHKAHLTTNHGTIQT